MGGVVHGLIASLAGRITDAFFKYVTLLLNTGPTNGAQNNTFLDSSTNNFSITRNGNTTQGTFSPFSQTGWSNFFDGTGDYLSVPRNNAFLPVANEDFTIEAWVYLTATPGAQSALIAGLGEYGTDSDWNFDVNSSLQVGFYINVITTSFRNTTTALTLNAWNHVAASRSGTGSNNLKVFVNGVGQSFTTNSTTVGTGDRALTIGADQNGDEAVFTGYISNLRLVKGTGVYTANFTPPTSPLTAITNTSLLTCQSNRFIDNSSNAFAITSNGDVSVQAFSPFNPTAAWSAGTNGGSGYFDGTGDTLVTPSITIGTNAFCFECWFYPTVTQGAIAGIFVAVTNDGLQCSYYDATGSGGLGIAQKGVAWQIFNSNGVKPTVNQWNHIAFVRSGTGTNQTSIFLNGTRIVNGTVSFNYVASNYELSTTLATGTVLQGYVGSSRLTIGSSPYDATLTTLTVPTSPLTAITNTSLLLNFTNAGIFDSASGNNLETVGNAQVSTTQAKWSTTSMGFDGTGDWLFWRDDKPSFRLGTAAFTIEMWVYRSASGTYGLVSKGTNTTGWSVSLNASNQVVFSFAASSFNSTGTVAATTWTHIAVVREGTGSNQTKIYINGTNDGTGTVATNFSGTDVMYVGADRVAGSNLNGYIDELRITNGYARYTANFTPPTAAFPTS